MLFPGELIQAEVLQLLREAVAQGGYVTGAGDSTLSTLLVIAVKEERQ